MLCGTFADRCGPAHELGHILSKKRRVSPQNGTKPPALCLPKSTTTTLPNSDRVAENKFERQQYVPGHEHTKKKMMVRQSVNGKCMKDLGLAPLGTPVCAGASWQPSVSEQSKGLTSQGRTRTRWGGPTRNAHPSFPSQMPNLTLCRLHVCLDPTSSGGPSLPASSKVWRTTAQWAIHRIHRKQFRPGKLSVAIFLETCSPIGATHSPTCKHASYFSHS